MSVPPSSDSPPPETPSFVSRGGQKLAHAVDAFGLDPTGAVCVDLGCSTGGFVDCWIRNGAARVYAVDTAYGELAWTLRQDERVVVMERTNALHAEPPEGAVPVGFVSIDLGWTRQDRALPAAARWSDGSTRIVTLIKPHYELDKPVFQRVSKQGVIPDDLAQETTRKVVESLPALGFRVEGLVESPIRGGKKLASGNREWLALVRLEGEAG